MNYFKSIILGIICAAIFFFSVLNINAAVISFDGQLDYIEYDHGGAYSEVSIGTEFFGGIDDANGSGFITDGVNVTSFDSQIAAGGLIITNDMMLSTEDADFLNTIAGSQGYTAGDIVDAVNIEGDATTVGGGRIEVGLTYILPHNSFDDNDLSNYPVNIDDVELALFFIYEEDNRGNDIYSAGGRINLQHDSGDFSQSNSNFYGTYNVILIIDGDCPEYPKEYSWISYIGDDLSRRAEGSPSETGFAYWYIPQEGSIYSYFEDENEPDLVSSKTTILGKKLILDEDWGGSVNQLIFAFSDDYSSFTITGWDTEYNTERECERNKIFSGSGTRSLSGGDDSNGDDDAVDAPEDNKEDSSSSGGCFVNALKPRK